MPKYARIKLDAYFETKKGKQSSTTDQEDTSEWRTEATKMKTDHGD